MNTIFTMDPILEISIGLNYVIVAFLFQIGVFFMFQWKQVKNLIVLSYGFYFIFYSLGILIYFYISNNDMSLQTFNSALIISNFMRGTGVILFSIIMEYKLRNIFKTKYLFSISSSLLVLTIPYFINEPQLVRIIDLFNLFSFFIPFIFTIYFFKNSLWEVRKKLKFSIMGLIVSFGSLALSSQHRLEMINALLPFPHVIIFSSKLLAILGLFMIFYGFLGYSFYLESQWKYNLVSIHVMMKTKGITLYQKNYLESEIRREDLFAGGISGVSKTMQSFTDSKKQLQEIQIGENLILLEFGEYIMTGMIIKRRLLNARYVLREINQKFEQYFWDYLTNYDDYSESYSNAELFKPFELIINELIKI